MIELGEKVEDKVTGFKGTAVSKVEMLNGCIQYEVAPKVKKDGTMQDSKWIDVQQLEVCKGKKVAVKKSNTGGPLKNTPTNYGQK